jgi:hypothetical protein
MTGKKVLGWNLASKNLLSKSEVSFQRSDAGYNEESSF